MPNIETLWKKAVEFHGHSCPGLAIGVVAGKIVLEEFGERAKDEELVAVVENDACGVDAIQTILGCTFGKGNLIHMDYGKAVYTFYNRGTGRAIRLSRRPKTIQSKPETQKKNHELFEKVRNGAATEQELAEYKRHHQNLIIMILECGRDVFTIQEINMLPPEKARIIESTICDNCKEVTMMTKIREINGTKFCIPCYQAIASKKE